MARMYDYNVPRSQDYLVAPMSAPTGGNSSQGANTYRPNFSGGGQTVFGGAKRQTPDLNRQGFRAGERQIRENTVRPLDLSFIDADKNRAMDYVRTQGTKQLDAINASKQGLNAFLPDLTKAVLNSDEDATQKISQRLASENANLDRSNLAPITTNIQDASLDILKKPTTDTYQYLLDRSRGGGTLMTNQLDAMIAARSGDARKQLNQKARELAGVNETAGNYNRTIDASAKNVESAFDKTTDDIKNYLSSLESQTKSSAAQRVDQYKNRSLGNEIQTAKVNAINKLVSENPNLRGFVDSAANASPLDQFFDRDLSIEEAYSDQDVRVLNNVSKLLGGKDVYTKRAQDATYNETALMDFLRNLGTANFEKDRAAKEAQARAEQAAREAAARKEAERKAEEERIRLNEIAILKSQEAKKLSPVLSAYENMPSREQLINVVTRGSSGGAVGNVPIGNRNPVVAKSPQKRTFGSALAGAASSIGSLFGRR